jgi:hypothetical protein
LPSRPPDCELQTTSYVLSGSGCPEGCRTHRCSETATERTGSAMTRAAWRWTPDG